MTVFIGLIQIKASRKWLRLVRYCFVSRLIWFPINKSNYVIMDKTWNNCYWNQDIRDVKFYFEAEINTVLMNDFLVLLYVEIIWRKLCIYMIFFATYDLLNRTRRRRNKLSQLRILQHCYKSFSHPTMFVVIETLITHPGMRKAKPSKWEKRFRVEFGNFILYIRSYNEASLKTIELPLIVFVSRLSQSNVSILYFSLYVTVWMIKTNYIFLFQVRNQDFYSRILYIRHIMLENHGEAIIIQQKQGQIYFHLLFPSLAEGAYIILRRDETRLCISLIPPFVWFVEPRQIHYAPSTGDKMPHLKPTFKGPV